MGANQQINITPPVYLGIMEPLDVISVQDPWFGAGGPEKKLLIVMGQLVNGTGREQIVKNLHLHLKDSNSAWTKDEDLTPGNFFDLEGSNVFNPSLADGNPMPIARFLVKFELPNNFLKGQLEVVVQGSVRNYNNSMFSKYKIGPKNFDVDLAPSDTLLAPVEGFDPITVPGPGFMSSQFVDSYWWWGNGPAGEESSFTPFSTHSRPEARYSYDLEVHKREPSPLGDFDPVEEANTSLSANMVSFFSTSDKRVNSNFFCWRRPILCMHKGTVQYVKDDTSVTTQSGWSPTIPSGTNSVVVVQHEEDEQLINRWSKYYHLAQGSATVRGIIPGKPVEAGEILGNIDNTGYSSEPHLHIGYFKYDATGRLRALPMRFQNLEVHICSGVSGYNAVCNDLPMPFVPTGFFYYNPVT